MMRRRSLCLVALLLLIVTFPLPAWSLDTSAEDILRSPDRYDGQVVTLRGVVTALRARLSNKGNDYYTFTSGRMGTSKIFQTCPAATQPGRSDDHC
jgi:hypothetical protein